MLLRGLLVCGAVVAVSLPLSAQAADTATAANADSWAVFQKLYPRRALAAREEGAVGFKVTIDKAGTVTGCQVTRSSGHPLLDQETCTLITLNAQFQPEPDLTGSQVRTRDGTIAWKLPASGTQLAAPKAIAAAEAPAKVICKRTVRTGTISGFERTCMTQREWTRQGDEMKQPWEDMQGSKGSTSGN